MTTDTLEFPPIVTAQDAVAATVVAPAAPSIKDAAIAHLKAREPEMRALAERYRAVAFDMSTMKGLGIAKAARHDLRENGRFAIQRGRDATKDLLNTAKKDVEAEAERLIAIVKPVEDAIDAQIVAREEVIAAEKAERDRIEAERVQAHQARLATLHGYVQQAQGLPASRIANGIAAVEAIAIDPVAWEEFADRAVAAKEQTLAALRAMLETAQQREAEAAERERQRQEQLRVAEEQRLERARLKAEAAEIARVKAELAEDIARQKAKIAAAQEAAKPKDEQVRPDVIGQPRFDGERFGMVSVDVAPPVERRVITVELDNEPDELPPPPAPAPTLKLGQIGERLGFTLTQAFVASLGFEPAGRDKNAVLFHESDWPLICDALVAHINARKVA